MEKRTRYAFVITGNVETDQVENIIKRHDGILLGCSVTRNDVDLVTGHALIHPTRCQDVHRALDELDGSVGVGMTEESRSEHNEKCILT